VTDDVSASDKNKSQELNMHRDKSVNQLAYK